MTPPRLGRRVRRFGAIDSTMDEAVRLAMAGEPEGTVVIAAEQTAGRGRSGRAWIAPAGSSLLCSVLLRPATPPERLPVLSLLVGAAAAEAIADVSGLQCRLKWPNDLWLGDDDPGRKAGGILLASRLARGGIDYAIAGVGINLTGAPADLPPGATSLAAEVDRGASWSQRGTEVRAESPRGYPEVPPGLGMDLEHGTAGGSSEAIATDQGRDVDAEMLLAALLARLNRVYADFLAAGGYPSLDAWRRRAALVGQAVTIADGEDRHTGRFIGIDDDGRLLLEDVTGAIRPIVAGDLTRGPRLPGR